MDKKIRKLLTEMLNRRTEPILVITCGLTQVLNKKINQTIKHKGYDKANNKKKLTA